MEVIKDISEDDKLNLEFNLEKPELVFKESCISKNHIGSGKLLESDSFPGKIIRKEKVSTILLKHGGAEDPLPLVELASNLFFELENRYGISVPLENIWIDNDNQCVYSVVEIISKKEDDPTIIAKKAEILYSSISKYFLDKFIEGGPFLWDINSQSQYIYGTRLGEDEANYHLVDTDIWMNNDSEQIPFVVYWLTRHMSGLERSVGTIFESARSNIENLVSAALVRNSGLEGDEYIKSIKQFLNHSRSPHNPSSAIPKYKI